MNEASKLMVAAALVAFGLGLAYLCGPPADSPQVVRDMADVGAARQLAPAGTVASTAPLRLHADALPPDEILVGAAFTRHDPGIRADKAVAETIILSTAEAAVQDAAPQEPSWHSPSVDDKRDLIPPRAVEMDGEAAPLSALAPPRSGRRNSPDDWLLAAPAIPRSYDAPSARGTIASSRADDRSTDRNEKDVPAWWTRDTPRLQGLNASEPPDRSVPHKSGPTSQLVPLPPRPSNNTSLAAPIDLDNASEKPPSAAPSPVSSHPRPMPPPAVAVPQPTRTHLIVDGDTLTRLAERYLGDAGRAEDILELNRGVLSNPDLLPIGRPLRIPAAGRAEPVPEPGEETSSSRLVPVAKTPAVAELQPHAQLQCPAPIAASGW